MKAENPTPASRLTTKWTHLHLATVLKLCSISFHLMWLSQTRQTQQIEPSNCKSEFDWMSCVHLNVLQWCTHGRGTRRQWFPGALAAEDLRTKSGVFNGKSSHCLCWQQHAACEMFVLQILFLDLRILVRTQQGNVWDLGLQDNLTKIPRWWRYYYMILPISIPKSHECASWRFFLRDHHCPHNTFLRKKKTMKKQVCKRLFCFKIVMSKTASKTARNSTKTTCVTQSTSTPCNCVY